MHEYAVGLKKSNRGTLLHLSFGGAGGAWLNNIRTAILSGHSQFLLDSCLGRPLRFELLLQSRQKRCRVSITDMQTSETIFFREESNVDICYQVPRLLGMRGRYQNGNLMSLEISSMNLQGDYHVLEWDSPTIQALFMEYPHIKSLSQSWQNRDCGLSEQAAQNLDHVMALTDKCLTVGEEASSFSDETWARHRKDLTFDRLYLSDTGLVESMLGTCFQQAIENQDIRGFCTWIQERFLLEQDVPVWIDAGRLLTRYIDPNMDLSLGFEAVGIDDIPDYSKPMVALWFHHQFNDPKSYRYAAEALFSKESYKLDWMLVQVLPWSAWCWILTV